MHAHMLQSYMTHFSACIRVFWGKAASVTFDIFKTQLTYWMIFTVGHSWCSYVLFSCSGICANLWVWSSPTILHSISNNYKVLKISQCLIIRLLNVLSHCFFDSVCVGMCTLWMCASLAPSLTVLLTTRNSLTWIGAESRAPPQGCCRNSREPLVASRRTAASAL